LFFFKNGKTTRTISPVSLGGGKGCWSQTFDSTKRLMVELVRFGGYFNRENELKGFVVLKK